jgi:nitrogen regulatory protein PII
MGLEAMKIVMAIIKPFKFDEFRDALIAVEVHGMTATLGQGIRASKNHTAIYRGAEYAVTLLPMEPRGSRSRAAWRDRSLRGR